MTVEHPRIRHIELAELGLTVLQRDWLSANHVIFPATDQAPSTVVDTGYSRHSAISLALIDHALSGEPVRRIVNTHLHSDHCGGNRALQNRDPTVQVWVPAMSADAAKEWDQAKLSYRRTGQLCERFRVDGALNAGDELALGPATWQVHAAPGHDPDAILLFEPQTRVLIAGDALWEDRLAIIFPELGGEDGFKPTSATLDLIEQLAPSLVIPGHGGVFKDVQAAVESSRKRLHVFQQDPQRHVRHAARALLMFHMMEHQVGNRLELESWLARTPIFLAMAKLSDKADLAGAWAAELIDSLIDDGLISSHQGKLGLAADLGR
ncbi:MAG: MBL fold metallo-hydrolase [Burkholderiales bacterium]|nr:MBL fold metallo-hydrolase [Burkholderiales bacterium]